MWAILIVTLPAQPNAVRLRTWRTLKGMGCAALRDGAYLLPLEHAALLDPVARDVRAHGGTAAVHGLSPLDDVQRNELLAQFDRSAAYMAWREDVRALHQTLEQLSAAEARRRLRRVADTLASLQRIDYYPGPAAAQASADLAHLQAAVEASYSVGEPVARAGAGIERLDRARFRRKRWVTRARPWVDRLASAWLVLRFIDQQARFLWLDDPTQATRGAIGFDYDGAQFTHVGARVTFEVLAASFAVDRDPRLAQIASVVHYLDVGGIPVAQAAGLEAVLAGLREMHRDDQQLFEAAVPVFDALYSVPEGPLR